MALMPVADALARVLAGADALPAETVKLEEALGRVLAADLAALRTQPPVEPDDRAERMAPPAEEFSVTLAVESTVPSRRTWEERSH